MNANDIVRAVEWADGWNLRKLTRYSKMDSVKVGFKLPSDRIGAKQLEVGKTIERSCGPGPVRACTRWAVHASRSPVHASTRGFNYGRRYVYLVVLWGVTPTLVFGDKYAGRYYKVVAKVGLAKPVTGLAGALSLWWRHRSGERFLARAYFVEAMLGVMEEFERKETSEGIGS